MSQQPHKIFGIGLSKTGTTSLSKALEILGISSIHYPKNLEIIDNFMSATDLPIAMAFEELDHLYPNSLFILTTRDLDEWLTSMEQHISKLITPSPGTRAYNLRLAAYGSATFNLELAKAGFQKHQKNVEKYFLNRKNDLLVMKQPEDFNWPFLCRFLGKPVPEVDFPKENVESSTSIQRQGNRS